jgi:hypothetical protein
MLPVTTSRPIICLQFKRQFDLKPDHRNHFITGEDGGVFRSGV